MYQIQVWLAPPAKCNDGNCIGDIVLNPRDSDGLGPIELIVKRPDVQDRVPRHLNLAGVTKWTLLRGIAESVNLVSAAMAPSSMQVSGESYNAITLAVSDPSNPAARTARIVVARRRGQPFKYRATWQYGYDDWIDEIVLRLAATNSDPWELLDLVCKAYLNVRVSGNVLALEFRVGYGTEDRFVAL